MNKHKKIVTQRKRDEKSDSFKIKAEVFLENNSLRNVHEITWLLWRKIFIL